MNLTGIKAKDSYRGILNLAGSNQVLDTTLRTVTDGMGNASPLQLSTTNVSISASGVAGLIIDQDIVSVTASSRLFFRNNSQLFSFSLSGNELGFRTAATLGVSSGAMAFKYGASGVTIGGEITNAARLHVRGDGTNPIALFENNAGTLGFRVNNDRTLTLGLGTIEVLNGGPFNFSVYTSNLAGAFNINAFGAYNFNSGTNTGRLININYTVNTTGGTNTVTGLLLNATETSTTGTTHSLMDLQVGGVSRFRVANSGNAFLGTSSASTLNISNGANFGISIFGFQNTPVIAANTSISFGQYTTSATQGALTSTTLIINVANQLLQLGGTTNAFPAIKRSGAGIDFRLADDSGFCNITVAAITTNATANINTARMTNINDSTNSVTAINIASTTGNLRFSTPSLFAASGTINASAVLQADSTTRGFLPPRMNSTELAAIASPATGLVVYSTTENQLCLYNGTAWRKLNDSPL